MLGINANPGKHYTVEEIAAVGAVWTRTILYEGQEQEMVDWAKALDVSHIECQPIIIPQYVTQWNPGWTRLQLQPYAKAVADMCQANPGLFHHMWIGNEPNLPGGPTAMTVEDFGEWLIAFSTVLVPIEVQCISGALAGPKEFLEPILDVVRQNCAAVGIDAYTSTADTLDFVIDNLFEYVELPVAVGEIGIQTLDIDPVTGNIVEADPEPDQAVYYGSLVSWAHRREQRERGLASPRLFQFGIFCQGDDDVLGFGLQRADGSHKPSYEAYQTAAFAPLPGEETDLKIEEREQAANFKLGARWGTGQIHNLGADGKVRVAGYEHGVLLEIDGDCWDLAHLPDLANLLPN